MQILSLNCVGIHIYVVTGDGDWEWGSMIFKGASKEAKRIQGWVKAGSSQYNLVATCCQRQLSAVVFTFGISFFYIFFFISYCDDRK